MEQVSLDWKGGGKNVHVFVCVCVYGERERKINTYRYRNERRNQIPWKMCVEELK